MWAHVSVGKIVLGLFPGENWPQMWKFCERFGKLPVKASNLKYEVFRPLCQKGLGTSSALLLVRLVPLHGLIGNAEIDELDVLDKVERLLTGVDAELAIDVIYVRLRS